MKKSFFALLTAVAVIFIAAMGLCVRALQNSSVAASGENGLCVVVDAGHGGIDGGVVGRRTGVKESDVNLQIAYALHAELTDMGFEVVLTRKTQAGLYGTTAKGFKRRDMQRRREIIQSARPDFILSLHQNFYPLSSTRGAQVFYAPDNAQGKRFAMITQEKLNALYGAEGVKDRKATAGDFFMLECWDCPSVLIECGFLSNAEDERLLCMEIWQRKLAKALASGVVECLSGDLA